MAKARRIEEECCINNDNIAFVRHPDILFLSRMEPLILSDHIVPRPWILGPGFDLPMQVLAETTDHFEIY